MLLRLSRISFWLAATAAVVALVAPAGHETWLTAVSGLACVLALAMWRSAAKLAQRDLGILNTPPEPVVLEAPNLLDAAALLLRAVHDAPNFDAALHGAARVLRNELGATEAAVHQVHEVDTLFARVSDLFEAQPGFRTTERRLRLDASAASSALRTGREAGGSPGQAAVPVLREGKVVFLIVLQGIELSIENKALTGLLELARLTLSQAAAHPLSTPAPATPARRAEDRYRGPPAAVPALRSTFSRLAPSGHAKVLVVEDNVVQPEATARMLRRVGCRVTSASGMLDGLNALRRTQFDLILVDLHLSGLGAVEGLERWRHGGAGVVEFVSVRDTPVIALSLSPLEGEEARLRELGFDDHLCKPFRQGQLLAMLNRHLRLQAPSDMSDASAHVPAGLGRPAGESVPSLDAGALARLVELDPTGQNRLVERVLQAFQTSVARLRPQLEAARGTGDRAAVRLVAHTLKSSSASIGAVQLSQLCAQVESAIRLETEGELVPHIEALGSALDDALLAIGSVLKERQ